MDDHQTETYRSMISISIETLKTILLINGAAAIAVLSYLSGRMPAAVRWGLSVSLVLFALGVGVAAISFVMSYATQLTLFNEGFARTPANAHSVYLRLAAGGVVLSILLFVIGAIWGAATIAQS